VNTGKVIGKVGKFNVSFREDKLSSHAGMVLIKEFSERLGVEKIIDEEMKVKERERGYSEGESVMGLVYNMIIGGSCLSDLNVLRGDQGTQELLGVESLIAPTTAGEFVRKFDIGDILDLSRTNDRLQQQVRPQQKSKVCTMDMDSSIFEQGSNKKEGSNKAYNGEIGYHPMFAFWEEEGELIFSHLRRGSAYTSSKAIWFMEQTLKRLPQGIEKKMRTDSGFYDQVIVRFCEWRDIIFGITADQTKPLMKLVAALSESSWEDLEKYGVAQVAELKYCPVGWDRDYRYVVKRNLEQKKTGELYFRYHILVTNNEIDSKAAVLEWHLQHANMENRIKEHKSGFALEKLPTQRFHANWAYLLIGQIAFNLVAWFKRLILPKDYHNSTIRTIRHHILNLAAKIVHTARQFYLIISDHYSFQHVWNHALKRLAMISFA
jgi:hypothetical protein